MVKKVENFLSTDEIAAVSSYAMSCQPPATDIENPHIKAVNDHINGFSILKDMTNTEVSSYLSKFQGDNTCVEEMPQIFYDIKDRIALHNIGKTHVFCQLIVINAGGHVKPHYDAAIPGYITYKCNIPIQGEEIDHIYVDKSVIEISLGGLYCFEANLFKHWMNASLCDKILLSYGFIVPCEDLGWDRNAPRIKMSNRIWQKFIQGKSDKK